MSSNSWVPLEGNADVLETYIHNLGAPEDVHAIDMWSLDQDCLGMFEGRCIAMIFLLELTPSFVEHEHAQDGTGHTTGDYSVKFFKQLVGNSCGTMAVLHSLSNFPSDVRPVPGSWLESFVSRIDGLTPEQAGEVIASDETLRTMHGGASTEGQTDAPPADDDTDLHFVALVLDESQSHLMWLDGRRQHPICLGDSSLTSLLSDSARTIRDHISRWSEGSPNFSAIGLFQDSH